MDESTTPITEPPHKMENKTSTITERKIAKYNHYKPLPQN